MTSIGTVVVAIDFSDTCEDTLAAARQLMRTHGGRLHLIHVVADVFHAPWMAQAEGLELPALQRRFVDDAQEHLAAFAAAHGLDPQTASLTVAVGQPAGEIVRHATGCGAQAIVVGSHGRGFVGRFLLGSVAERVLRQATCPVLVVPKRRVRETATDAVALFGAA